MIDAHTHLCAPEFDEDLPRVIQDAKSVGVQAALVVAEFVSEFPKILQLADRYPDFCLPCMGVHPVQGDPKGEQRSVSLQDLEEAVPIIEEHHDRLIAVGEVGLDFTPYYCKQENDKDIQRAVLTKQVELATRLNLPLNVHSRSAGRPTIELLKSIGANNVLLHAFSGRPAVAMEGVQAGYYFSVPPSFARKEKEKLIERIPLDNLLLETDSPALGPEKGGRNVPRNIQISCEFISKVKKTDVETVIQITRENTLKLFPKIKNLIET